MFEFNRMYTLPAPKGSISDMGRMQIIDYIASQRLQEGEWNALNPDNPWTILQPLPELWQWLWKVTGKGDYVGTFPKRASKYYYQFYHLKCPRYFLERIGNLARLHTEENAEYRFDFTNTIDWNDGDFGDAGSCYWWADNIGRDILEANGGFAIRFYNADSTGKGRAWIAPVDLNEIVFNGYGFPGNSTLTIARIYAEFTGKSYKKISLSNHGGTTGNLYINSGIGYIIGTQANIEHVTQHDLEWGDYANCENCGRQLTESSVYIGLDDEQYCENCYYERYDTCAMCDETHYHDDLYFVECDYQYVCDSCLDRHYSRCDECEEWYRTEDLKPVKERYLCENCQENEPDEPPPPESED